MVLQVYIRAVQDAETRLTRQIQELLPSWSMPPVVMALQAMRVVAVTASPRSPTFTAMPMRSS